MTATDSRVASIGRRGLHLIVAVRSRDAAAIRAVELALLRAAIIGGERAGSAGPFVSRELEESCTHGRLLCAGVSHDQLEEMRWTAAAVLEQLGFVVDQAWMPRPVDPRSRHLS